MARWSALTQYLATADDICRLTFDELSDVVGALPPSAFAHRAWWSGDRPHVRAWREAGYRLDHLSMGEEVTFTRDVPSRSVSQPALPPPVDWSLEVSRANEGTEQGQQAAHRILLVACSKGKLDHPAAAKDLYSSTLFRSARAYAEAAGTPWFILSAEHGLVAPDDWLAPYDRYLPDTPRSFREAWSHWVVERLELLAGSLANRTIEIHAGSTYVQPLEVRLGTKGCRVKTPLAGLAVGERQRWYLVELERAEARRHPDNAPVHSAFSR